VVFLIIERYPRLIAHDKGITKYAGTNIVPYFQPKDDDDDKGITAARGILCP